MYSQQDLLELASHIDGVSASDLSRLNDEQVSAIEATDTNWCDDFAAHGFESEADAISAALWATHEEVTK